MVRSFALHSATMERRVGRGCKKVTQEEKRAKIKNPGTQNARMGRAVVLLLDPRRY
jgi:hypothetical protein